ncbi:MAG: SDR family NAD(P)-dependent oxidoreductase [Comamonadaceae bacterium]|nr:MAG: SDR family NAD(P)-dependent oxidoreductase [Comamonadaceae bacterium]
MNLYLKGSRVLVTGSSKGIGLAIALAFAHEGAIPVLVSRSAGALDAALKSIHEATGVSAQAIEADLSTAEGRARLVAEVGEIDVLVNNAGAIPGGSLADIGEARWREAWELKLFGYINLIRDLLPAMEKRGSGVICNIIGMAGAAPRAEYVCGSTANAALMAFTQATGAASPRHGVRVFGINPSLTRSDRMEGMLQQQAKARLGDENRWAELTANLPFGRPAEPQEIADLTVFGCSPRSGYLSGTVINVDGGQMYATAR